MFSLKDFLTAMVFAVLCLFVRITPAFASQVEIFIPTEDYSVETVSVESTTDNSIHAPPQENYEEIQIIPDKMRITLTTENDIVVETFYPLENEENIIKSKVDDEVIFMFPLITKNSTDSEVELTLALSTANFPCDNGYETIAQCGLMCFF